MAHCATHLALESRQHSSSWGFGNVRPLAVGSGLPTCLLMASPPFTVRLRTTIDGLKILNVNLVLTLYTETHAMVLPPDVEENGKNVPFYLDPPQQPGLHRDLFQQHAKKMLGQLLLAGFEVADALVARAPITVLDQIAAQEQAATAAREKEEATAAAAEGLYMVEAILEQRFCAPKRKRGGVSSSSLKLEYLVQWKGYGPEFRSWEPEAALKRLDVLTAWKKEHPAPSQ